MQCVLPHAHCHMRAMCAAAAPVSREWRPSVVVGCLSVGCEQVGLVDDVRGCLTGP